LEQPLGQGTTRYAKAVLVKMDSSACGYPKKAGKTIAAKSSAQWRTKTPTKFCAGICLQTSRNLSNPA